MVSICFNYTFFATLSLIYNFFLVTPYSEESYKLSTQTNAVVSRSIVINLVFEKKNLFLFRLRGEASTWGGAGTKVYEGRAVR